MNCGRKNGIGERSSLTWYVLKYLPGYPNVKNHNGSWTEWGNLMTPRSRSNPVGPGGKNGSRLNTEGTETRRTPGGK
jgi:hypothetical protein